MRRTLAMLRLDEKPRKPGSTVRIAVILRVAPAALDAGRFAAEVECIETGRRGVVRSHDELVSFLRHAEAASSPPAPAAPPHDPTPGDLQ